MTKLDCLKVAKFVFVLLVLPLSFVVFVNLSRVYAQTSNSISFQGKIVRNDSGYEGLNVTDGSPACVTSGSDTCDFRIQYYSESVGGTLFFTETFENVEIGQYGGVFELGLGTGTATAGSYSALYDMIQKENSVYVEILFSPAGDGSYTETFSRMPLRSSAFSVKSKFAEKAAGAFLFENSSDSLGYTGSSGMVYYDTTNAQLMLYTGGSWQPIATGGSSIWTGADISSYTHAQFVETSGIATLPNFGIDVAENRAWIHGDSSRTGLSVYSNYSGGTDWPLVSFKADGSSFGGSILRLIQDGTGTLLEGYKGSNPVFRFDNSGNLHLESNGVMYFEGFSTLPTSLDLAPLSGEGCVYTVGPNIYWDAACNGSAPVALNTSSDLWSDAGAFTFLTSSSDNLILGASTVAEATFFFDVAGTSGNYFEVDNADNTERLFTISNTGNVGIGVENPTSRLQVAGAASTISNSSGDLSILSATNLIFSTNSVERMRILATGNVGVGTSTPTSLFSVGSTNGFQVDGSGDIVSIKGLSYLWPTAHTTNGILTNNGTGTLSWATITSLGGVTGTGAAGQIAFFDSNTSITGDNGFFWDNVNKRLGIGTTTPQSTIDIAGATSEIANSDGPITVMPATGNLRLIGPGMGDGESYISFGNEDYVTVGEYGSGDTNILGLSGYFGVYAYSNANSMQIDFNGVRFFTNTTERMRITNDGKVGIGNNLVYPTGGLDVSFTSSDTSDFIGSRVQATQTVSGALTVFGYRAIAETTHTTGSVQGIQANSTQINVLGNGGTVNYAEGLTSVANVGTGATITNLALVRVFATTGVGTITNLKGIQIGNMNTGTSSNYSIYSEGGTMYHAGNVGIGTTNPGSKLEVNGGLTVYNLDGGSTSESQIFLANPSNSSSGIVITRYGNTATGTNFGLSRANGSLIRTNSAATDSAYFAIGSTGNIPVIFGANNAEVMRLAANGNVGIGTTNPGTKLEVNGNIATTPNRAKPALILDSISSGDNWASQGAYISIGESGDLGSAAMHMTYRGDGYGFIGAGLVDNAAATGGAPAGGYIRFNYTGKEVYLSDNLWVSSKIGIGRSPSYTFDVNGTARIMSATGASLEIGSGVGTNVNAYIDLTGDTTYTDYGLRLIRENTGANANSALLTRGTGLLSIGASEAGSVRFITTNAARLAVNSNGSLTHYNPSAAYDFTTAYSGVSGTYGYSSYRISANGGNASYPSAKLVFSAANYSTNSSSALMLQIGTTDAAQIAINSTAMFIDNAYQAATTAGSIYMRFSSSYTNRFQFRGDGTGLADVAWITFSPYLSYNYIDPSKTKNDYELGDVVVLDTSNRWVVNQTGEVNDEQLYGVVVRPEGFVSIPKELKSQITEDRQIESFNVVPVAHLGEASTKVLVKPGETITSGLYVTSSNIEGFAQLAKKPGNVLGKALESTADWSSSRCTAVGSINSVVWPEDDGSNPSRPCYKLPDGSYVGKIMIFVNVSWYDPGSVTTETQITQPGWYRILQTNGTESATVKISNSTVGTNQNINLIIDPNNMSIMSNFTSGNSIFSKARLNNIDGITYLEVYIENPSSNNVSVKIDSDTWSNTEISKVEEIYVEKEYALSGVQFGITDTFAIMENKESITTTTTSMYSDIGSGMNKWNDIYAKGAIRLGNGGESEGGIRYNVEKKKLEFSNDGVTWREVGDLTSSMVLSAEYSGAILYADGSENNGRMISDAVETDGIFKNYYEWVSDRETLQDYDILVRITLPNDFMGWNEDAISLDIMTENSASNTNNKVDISLLGNSGVDAQVVDGISKLPSNWERVTIKGTDIDSCNKANDTCTLKISMYSKEDYFVRVGDITLNYNRGL